MRQLLRRFGRYFPVLALDLIGLAGASCIAVGVWQIYPPAGIIAGGAMLIAIAFLFSQAE